MLPDAGYIRYCCTLCALILSVWACQSGSSDTSKGESSFPYRFDAPDTTIVLPPSLREISGLSLSSDGHHLLAVNDEEGIVFFINLENGAIDSTLEFARHGDYEGIEAVGEYIYVVKSNGKLYRISPDGKTETIETSLHGGNNVEGLCYDALHGRLLLACKGEAGEGARFKGKKAVYAYDLHNDQFLESPVYLLNRDTIAAQKRLPGGLVQRLNDFFSTEHASTAFSPSGLAVHPADSLLYVIASVGKSIVAVHEDGRIAGVAALPADILPQPEGICFDRLGRLYISTEGRKQSGRILRFSKWRQPLVGEK
ncbi:MAG: hypothetical protein H6575_05355 [Lewinellaceae bacterium]|nr:hypothetical protein [Lewinellaceae bacterium]